MSLRGGSISRRHSLAPHAIIIPDTCAALRARRSAGERSGVGGQVCARCTLASTTKGYPILRARHGRKGRPSPCSLKIMIIRQFSYSRLRNHEAPDDSLLSIPNPPSPLSRVIPTFSYSLLLGKFRQFHVTWTSQGQTHLEPFGGLSWR